MEDVWDQLVHLYTENQYSFWFGLYLFLNLGILSLYSCFLCISNLERVLRYLLNLQLRLFLRIFKPFCLCLVLYLLYKKV